MVFKYDGYVVWSEHGRRHLHEYYPHTRDIPAYIVGAPQFDVFRQERFRQTREEFCRGLGLDPKKKIILYALGSPNVRRRFALQCQGQPLWNPLPFGNQPQRHHLRIFDRVHPRVYHVRECRSLHRHHLFPMTPFRLIQLIL